MHKSRKMSQTSGDGSSMVIGLGVIEIVLIGTTGYLLSTLVGNYDTRNDLVKTVLPATGLLGVIVLIHTLLWYYYFTYKPLSMNMYFLMSTSMSIIISLTALSISLVNRS